MVTRLHLCPVPTAAGVVEEGQGRGLLDNPHLVCPCLQTAPGMDVLAAGEASHNQPFVAAWFAGWLAANEGATPIHMGSLRPGAGRKCLCQI